MYELSSKGLETAIRAQREPLMKIFPHFLAFVRIFILGALIPMGAVAVAVLLMRQPLCAMAQQGQPAAAGFSFAVYGDSRSMFYLPYKSDQEAEARELMIQMFELVFPKNIAEVVVQRDVKFIYDRETHELAEVIMPFDTKYEVTTLTLGSARRTPCQRRW